MAEKRKVPKVRMVLRKGYWQIRYTCPTDKREVRISTKTADEQEAIEQRKGIEAKLQLGIEITPRRKITLGASLPWADFREEYSRLKVATMRSSNAAATAEYRLDVCQAVMQPRTLGEMANPSTLATLQARLLAGDGGREKARSPHTVKSYMATLIAALNWSHRPMRWLTDRVEFDLLETDDPMKGRPLCAEEFERMLAAIPKALAADGGTPTVAAVDSWQLLLRCLWESGLRLSEAMAMHWEADSGIVPHVTRSGLLLLSIPAKLQKSRRAQEVPTTPAFAALLQAMPNRKGWIFNPIARRGKVRPTHQQVGRIITRIGSEAMVKVNAGGKPASAHDLRRSFGQRMADAGLPPRDLQAIMRHASFVTTESYYLRDRAQDQGQRIAKYLGTVANQPTEKTPDAVDVKS
jgi:integrase